MIIKCLLVGGNSAIEFGKFIKDSSGGSVEVIDTLSSFVNEEVSLKKRMIRCTKLVWFIDSSLNLKEDLRVLNERLQDSTYFKADEIYIFGVMNNEIKIGLRMFKQLMQEQELTNYVIKVKEKPSTYQMMYNELLGSTDESSKVTKRKVVYRATVGDTSKRGYNPKFYDRNIIPMEKDNVRAYEDSKASAIKAETNRIIKDTPESLPNKVNLSISNLDLSKVKNLKNIILVCGNPKSGVSTLATHITKFLVYTNKHVDYIDLSDNLSGQTCLNKHGLVNSKEGMILVDNKLLLTGKDYSNKPLAIYNKPRKVDNSISYLRYILSIPKRVNCDYMIIDCNLKDLDAILNMCNNKIIRVILTTQSVSEELLLLRKYIRNLNILKCPNSIFLNRSVTYGDNYKILEGVDAKQILPKGKFINYINFNETPDINFSSLIKEVNDEEYR